jgi:hypothetical protein
MQGRAAGSESMVLKYHNNLIDDVAACFFLLMFAFFPQGIGEKRAEYILELRKDSPRPFKSVRYRHL